MKWLAKLIGPENKFSQQQKRLDRRKRKQNCIKNHVKKLLCSSFMWNYGLFHLQLGAAFVLLSVANATVVFSPIPQQTWRKPAGFRRSQQHLAYYKLSSRGWWCYRSLVFVKAPDSGGTLRMDGESLESIHSYVSPCSVRKVKGVFVGVEWQGCSSSAAAEALLRRGELHYCNCISCCLGSQPAGLALQWYNRSVLPEQSKIDASISVH